MILPNNFSCSNNLPTSELNAITDSLRSCLKSKDGLKFLETFLRDLKETDCLRLLKACEKIHKFVSRSSPTYRRSQEFLTCLTTMYAALYEIAKKVNLDSQQMIALEAVFENQQRYAQVMKRLGDVTRWYMSQRMWRTASLTRATLQGTRTSELIVKTVTDAQKWSSDLLESKYQLFRRKLLNEHLPDFNALHRN